ncbi:AraC-type DNA-binding protein [Thermomonospora echinospora]|uniref:AraC-type DNA-binding protein n=1 Tax=Thermomonospora echinospora TaxID=1992 RepID=A0A1H6E4D7_9ACTN|nr:helix-turn-helix domain-containing protein [Thermomonospora echinospora]SEG92608.1 AraC-type DNA-binding protein [Thermomonospora echinospora]
MTGSVPDSTRGILRATTALRRFRMHRLAPSSELAPYAEYHWILRWDLRGQPPHSQQVLTHPSVHMTFTTGGRARVVGIVRGVFTETISGHGRVVGVRFLPGGFRPFLDGPVSALTGRYVPVEEIFGPQARVVADKVIAAPEEAEAIALMEDLLLARVPERPDPAVAEVAAIVGRIAADPTISRVDRLAADLGVGTRSLQRRFAEYVGVGPKWVIGRYRMQEAAERAAAGDGVDWAALAAELGYADQAHFVRDFTATVGTPPARYARDCATGAPGEAGRRG